MAFLQTCFKFQNEPINVVYERIVQRPNAVHLEILKADASGPNGWLRQSQNGELRHPLLKRGCVLHSSRTAGKQAKAIHPSPAIILSISTSSTAIANFEVHALSVKTNNRCCLLAPPTGLRYPHKAWEAYAPLALLRRRLGASPEISPTHQTTNYLACPRSSFLYRCEIKLARVGNPRGRPHSELGFKKLPLVHIRKFVAVE